jgi:ABC-type uncharacterized transport system involved in gliding motility auxiliary subunit
MSAPAHTRFGASSLLLLVIAFVAAAILSNLLFKGLRVDLTENNLYTLSDGTKRIVRNIDEPINLYFFFSDEATADVPALRDHAVRVSEMLEEFEDASRGKLNLRVIDPLPFSEEEDQAAQFGLEGVQLPTTPDAIYLGLAGTNSIGDEEVIAFFSPERLESLEYDIAKLVSTLADPERTVVGLVSGIAMTGGFDPQSQRMTPAWVVYEQASQLFEIRDLGTSFNAVPEDVGLLWIVQPKNLSAATQYAIDQFVMNGGQTLIFVDPLAQVDAMVQQGMPQGMPPVGQSSNLPQLFRGWGVSFEPQSVVADSTLALRLSDPMSGRPVRHYGYLGLGPEQMNSDDVVTMELGSVNAAVAGALAKAEGSEFDFEPLLWSSEDAAKLPASRFSFLMNPSELQQGFTPAGERFVLAARITGTLPSAFPEGPPAEDLPSIDPPGDEGAAAEEEAAYGENDEETADEEEHLAASSAPVNLVLVADVDLLSDPLWVTVQNFFGQQLASAFAGNGAFAVNSLESLAGSPDLIAVRSRGGWSRPFTRVDELRADAEARFLETEQRLQQELAETERRLGELQSAREDTGSLLLTDEQEAEIDRFVEQRAEIRQELRSVQRGLDEDIDKLGTWLKVINIALVPLLLTIGTALLLWHRRRRAAT